MEALRRVRGRRGARGGVAGGARGGLKRGNVVRDEYNGLEAGGKGEGKGRGG